MKKTRLLAFLLCLTMMLSVSALATDAGAYPKAEGESFTLFVKQQTIQPPYENIRMFSKYEEMTGIKINWINVPQDVVNERIPLTIAGSELPDAFVKCGINAQDLQMYGAAGDFLDLAPYLEEYAPNFWKYAQENPDVLPSLTSPTGEIYSLPAIADAPSTRINLKWFYNQDWLDKAGMQQPTTSEELYQVLKAFKEKDPNGNGEADEVPVLTSIENLHITFGGLFGLFNRGAAHHPYWDVDAQTNTLRYVRTSDAWREYLGYMNKLYSEGLIGQESVTYKVADVVALAAQNRLGMYVMTNLARLTDEVAANFEPISQIVEGPTGAKMWPATRSHLHSVGAFVITTECKNPELLLQWVDYFYSDEGVAFYHYGPIGETATQNADSSYQFTEDVLAAMKQGKSYDESIASVTPFGGGNNPSIMSWPGFAGMELTPKPMAASDVLKDYLPTTVWPFFTYTSDENDIVSTLGSDIDTYARSMGTKFLIGEEPLNDEAWNKYVQTINNMGMEEYYATVLGAAVRAEPGLE